MFVSPVNLVPMVFGDSGRKNCCTVAISDGAMVGLAMAREASKSGKEELPDFLQ